MLERKNGLMEIITPMYANASEITFDSFIEMAIADFEYRIMGLYRAAYPKEFSEHPIPEDDEKYAKYIKSTMESIAFYNAFRDANILLRRNYKTFTFKINPKSINFETLITDLQERLPMRKVVNVNEGQSDNTVKEIVCLTDIPNWQTLFGKGEFPCMHIYCFRLGNIEHFCYTISR